MSITDPFAVFVDPRGEVPHEVLGELLGVTAYDARLRVSGNLPRLLTIELAQAEAQAWAARIVEAGGRAVACRAQALLRPGGFAVAASLALPPGGDRFDVIAPHGRGKLAAHTINYIVQARAAGREVATETTTEKTLSVGKTMLSGGIPLRKKVTKSVETTKGVHETLLLFVFAARRVQPAFAVDAAWFDFGVLGERRSASTLTNFQTLATELAERANAPIDTRLFESGGELQSGKFHKHLAPAGENVVTARMLRMMMLRFGD